MANQNSSGFRTFTATAVAITEGLRVKVDSSGTISAADEAELGIGVAIETIPASGRGTVKLWTAPGTFLISAAGPITRGAALYTAAAGQVDDSGSYLLGRAACEAATTQGDLIEVVAGDRSTVAVGTYAAADIGTINAAGNSQGTGTAVVKKLTYVAQSDSTKGVTLPTATAGLVFDIINTVANQTLKIYPATGEYINAVQNTAKTLAAGQMAHLVCAEAGKWGMIFV